MSLARYGFLPWLRQGISAEINETDSLGEAGGTGGRPTVDVGLTIKGKPLLPPFYFPNFGNFETIVADPEATPDREYLKPENAEVPDKLVYKTLQLIGPGDITGIKRTAVVKTEPLDGVATFEPNYLPYIEFYEEDFPWRYSPVRAAGEKLRPWLVLVVLSEEEFERRFLPGAPLTAITHGTEKIAFPPAQETWAWAHVHVNKPLAEGDKAAALREVVDANPNLASARLLCPRRLQPNTSYTGFLLPAFEQGRLAGLGAPADRILSADIQMGSWDVHPDDEFAQLWPVYYEWTFRTGDLADFEYLVRRIEARIMEDPVGRRPMDMQDAGYELSYSGGDGTLLLEGALQLIGAQDEGRRFEFLDGESAETDFIEGLQTMLNLNTDLEEGAAGDAPANQTLYVDGDGKDDPIVTPPLYGQWHANTFRAETDDPGYWFNELNLDPRNRVAAGFGTFVVRRNQDAYMDRAWEQVGDVLEAQRRIRLSRFAAEAGRRLQRGYFDPMDESTYSAFSSSFHLRSRFVEGDFRATVQEAVRSRRVNTVALKHRINSEQLSLQLNDLEIRFYQQALLIVHARADLVTAERDEAAKILHDRLEELNGTLDALQNRINAFTDKPEEELTDEEKTEAEQIRGAITDLDADLEAEVRATADNVKSWRQKLNSFQNKPQEFRGELQALLAELNQLKEQLDGNLADRVNALEAELEAYGAMDLPDDQDDEASQSELEQLAARMEQLDAYLSTLEEKFPGQPDGLRRSSDDEDEETPKENLEAQFAPVSDDVQAFLRDVLDAIDLNTIDELHACVGSLDTELSGLEPRRQAVEKELGDLAAFREDLIRRINHFSSLYLPTSALRQDYRKLARPNGPAFRRVEGDTQGQDALKVLSAQIDPDTDSDDVNAIPEGFNVPDWEELSWGAALFKDPPVDEAEAITVVSTSTSVISQIIKTHIQATTAVQARLKRLFTIESPEDSEAAEIPKPLLAYPEFKEAMYAALAEISSELVLPNVQLIPMDTFSLLEVNQRFIESYLVGLNHEMARELLWREYPTDQRGSYFRRFWDDLDNLASTPPPPDIELLTELTNPLGENMPEDRDIPPPSPEDPYVVFVIRSELLKKFPNALIYMQRAAWATNDEGEEDKTLPRVLKTQPDSPAEGEEPEVIRHMPIFKASIYPEVSFFGFPVTADTALGSETDPGWFFVVQERPGEPRFGMDISPENESDTFAGILEWNDLAWPMVSRNEKGFIQLEASDGLDKPPKEGASDRYTWKRNAAHMAGILLQLPFMVAVHATDMIKLPE